MKLDGFFQLKSIHHGAFEDNTVIFGIFKTLEDAKESIQHIYKEDGDRIIIEYSPFGLCRKFSSKVVFNRIFDDGENWFDENKD